MLSTLNLRGAMLGALAGLLLTAPALGQETFAGDPLSLVRRLVDPAPIDDPTPYQGTDVNLSRLRGSIVKALVKVDRVELIEAKEQSAVAAAEFTPRIGGQSRAWDEYFYLSAEPSWKVVAHGRPPLPPWGLDQRWLGYQTEEELRTFFSGRGASAEQISELLELRKTAQLYGTDREVKAYFEQNRDRLNELRDKAMPLLKGDVTAKELIERKPEATSQLAGAIPDELDRITALLKETAAFWMGNTLFDRSYAEQISRDHPDWRYFNVAMWSFQGVVLGFFWKSENAEPPSLSPHGYLVIRSLGDGWYLYRTGA